MAIYLAEDQMGTDPNRIGFPTLGDCMGIAIRAGGRLHGFHAPKGHTSRVAAAKTLYVGHNADLLLCCCQWSNRYDKKGDAALGAHFSQFLAEVRDISQYLTYGGQVIGFNLSDVLTVPKGESAYCEFGLKMDGSLGIGFSLTSGTNATTTYDVNTPIKRVAENNSTSVPYKGKVFDNIQSVAGGFGTAKNAGIYQFNI